MRIAWVAGLVAALVATRAAAEVNDDPDNPLGIRVSVRDTTATVSVSYKFELEARERRSFMLLTTPDHAVVVGGSVRDGRGTYPLSLVRAEDSANAFDALMKAPVTRAQATLVQVAEDDFFKITVDAVAPRSTTLTLELQLELPTFFDRERRLVALPAFWGKKLPASLQRRIVKDPEISVYDGVTPKRTVLAFPAPVARASAGPHLAVSAGRFSDGKTQAARVELAIAKRMTDVPADLKTVFVIDVSRSMTNEQREAARAVVRSYLGHAPRSSVQVVGFARSATPLLAKWSAASASRSIDAQLKKVVPTNGSEVQLGLREAGVWLARMTGTRRIVLISDERVADRVAKLSTEKLARELPPGTLLHTVGFTRSGGVVRADEARWSALAAATGGIGAAAGVDDSGNVDALELVRPIALDDARVRADGWRVLEGSAEAARLDEGQALLWWGGSTNGDAVEVEGKLWNTRWSRTVALGDRGNLSIARQLRFVHEVGDALAVAALDASQSLSVRWSMVARWGGEGGYGDEPGGGGTGWGTTCGGCGAGTIGHGSGTGSGYEHEVTPLKVQLYEAVRRCTREGVAIALVVETTLDEIVDVTATATLPSGAAPTDAAQIETCVAEGVWSTNIRFSAPREHAMHKLTY